jgi:hypothetical protein
VAYTQADVDNVRAAIVEIATRGAAELEINGRRIKYSDPKKLQTLLEIIEGEVSSETYGGNAEAIFEETN